MGKRLGQHFLAAPWVASRICALAQLEESGAVLELGAGAGALTARLLESSARVAALEMDPRLCATLRARFAWNPQCQIFEGDMLKTPLESAFFFAHSRGYALVANLPYYLSSPFLLRLAAARDQVHRAVLLLQDEFARRMAASPAQGKVYGALSLICQYAFSVHRVLSLSPQVFQPPPRVRSALVLLEPRAPLLPLAQERPFFDHLQTLFTRRRKQMLPSLLRAHDPGQGHGRENHQETKGGAFPREKLTALLGKRRAEDLGLEEHLEVFRLLGSPQGKAPSRSAKRPRP